MDDADWSARGGLGSNSTRLRLLVVLYAIGLVLANPLFALGLFYGVFAVWIAFAAYARRPLRPSERGIVRIVWLFLVVWIGGIIPLMLFAVLPGAVLWYAGTVGTLGSASYVLGRALRTQAGTPGDRFRRYGVGAGIGTAILLLAPVFTGPFVAAAGPANPWLWYVPYLAQLVPAAVAIVCFALALASATAP